MRDVKKGVKGKRKCVVSVWLREEYVRERFSSFTVRNE